MVRKICCAVFALLVASGTAFPQSFFYRHSAHPHYRSFMRGPHFYAWCPPWLGQPYSPLPYQYPLPYGGPYSIADNVLPSPSYLFVGSASVSYPQLVFKDGTTYTVADYWREDDQLHFITVEEGGAKLVPHTVAFGDLDLDRTKARAKAQGFRFMIRDKPIEQWLEQRSQKHAPRSDKDGNG